MVVLLPSVISAFKPEVRSAASVCNGDDLDMHAEHAVDHEEREPTQQKSSRVADVRRWVRLQVAQRSTLRLVRARVENASPRFRCARVPPLCGLGFVGGQRVDFDRERRHQRAASRRRTSAQGMVFTAPLSSAGDAPAHLGRPGGFGVLVHLGIEALQKRSGEGGAGLSRECERVLQNLCGFAFHSLILPARARREDPVGPERQTVDPRLQQNPLTQR